MKHRINIAASVKARLLNIAHERNEDFQKILVQYANERLLYRLAVSPHADRFVLKGATLFTVWLGSSHRATRDLDLLGYGLSKPTEIKKIFSEIVRASVSDDGLVFDVDSIASNLIREHQVYGGVRTSISVNLEKARIALQVDVGFGDVITPKPKSIDFPVLLDFPIPRLHAYSKETVVAEKLEAMIVLGEVNSRMKDFFDIAFLAMNFGFNGSQLTKAVQATFQRRKTELPTGIPFALTVEFAEAKRAQWNAFVKRAGIHTGLEDLAIVMDILKHFLIPALQALKDDLDFPFTWKKGGPWK